MVSALHVKMLLYVHLYFSIPYQEVLILSKFRKDVLQAFRIKFSIFMLYNPARYLNLCISTFPRI